MKANKNREQEYAKMTAEELEQRYREAFFYTDEIDETVYMELERLGEALGEKRPAEFAHTAEESWKRFSRVHEEEIAQCCAQAARKKAAAKAGRYRAAARSVLIAAVAVVLLAGAALAADSLGLVAWVPWWNAATERYEPAAMEVSGEGPILKTLAELGITEPVYPGKLPEGFVITESRVSEDPLVLMEQYARNDQRLSITVTPIEGFKTAVYQAEGSAAAQYPSGGGVHYMFKNAGTITVVWYTKNYATSVSGDITMAELKQIINSPDGAFD
ncbi:MAG: DUF4367 domain-containing protein [Oscillospiraceae bacterium]|nr:DUF4367 domain-containing protein [Oscillospiraceae bacterium]